MDAEDLRIFTCDIIQIAGIILKLYQTAVTTAQMLIQRVYHTPNYTFDDHPLDINAMAALFLAAKIEECPRKTREVIEVFTHVLSKKLKRDILLTPDRQDKVRGELITAERRLLKNLGFNLLSSYPHKILVNYYFAIVNFLDRDHNVWKERDNQQLLQIAWNYCNDGSRTDIFLKYSKEAVACACIQMACEDTRMFFPKSTDGREWYQLFKDESEVRGAINLIKSLYDRKPANLQEVRRYMYLSTRL